MRVAAGTMNSGLGDSQIAQLLSAERMLVVQEASRTIELRIFALTPLPHVCALCIVPC